MEAFDNLAAYCAELDAAIAEPLDPNYVSEMSVELAGAPALNPFYPQTSSSRLQMFSSHLQQHLWFKGVEIPYITSGIERNFAKTTFGIKMPCDATIIQVIERYPKTIGMNQIKENPEIVVIYENFDTKVVGSLIIPRFHSLHKDFGIRYVQKNFNLLYPKNVIPKGTVFCHSPEIDDDYNYMYGANFNVAYMTLAGIAEDGIIARRGALRERMVTRAFGHRVMKYGSKHYPTNSYGKNPLHYQPTADIGEHIRDDGLVFALRGYDPLLAPVEMTPEALMELDQVYDKPTYGEPGARVTDIKVWRERHGKQQSPVGMSDQFDKYADAATIFYGNIVSIFGKLRSERGDNLKFTPEFQRLVTEAIADQGIPDTERVQKTYRMQPLDEYRVELTYEYDLTPTIGFKVSDRYGGDMMTERYRAVSNYMVDTHI